MLKFRKLFIWSRGVDDILSGTSKVSGISLQMLIWARSFIINGWEVGCLTDKPDIYKKGQITFFPLGESHFLGKIGFGLLFEAIRCFIILKKCRPEIVFMRGAEASTSYVALICKLLHIKFVFLGASDVNFEGGKKLVENNLIKTKLYEFGIRHTRYFITQNSYQSETLLSNFKKKSLILPNIWTDIIPEKNDKPGCEFDVVWVANLRPLKRAEWLLNLAKQMPSYMFAIVGGAIDQEYYINIKGQASVIQNVSFLGATSFFETTHIIYRSKILICTSEYEGFPNTFIQAWSGGKPVVSTVDPSGVINRFNLGRVVSDEAQLYNSVKLLLTDKSVYTEIEHNVQGYFMSHHSAKYGFDSVMDYLYPGK